MSNEITVKLNSNKEIVETIKVTKVSMVFLVKTYTKKLCYDKIK